MSGPIPRSKSGRVQPEGRISDKTVPAAAQPETPHNTVLEPLFRYIWKHSRGQQIAILLFVVLSLPFYFASLDLPKSIVNDAIQGRAFANGREHAPLFRYDIALPQWLGGAD